MMFEVFRKHKCSTVQFHELCALHIPKFHCSSLTIYLKSGEKAKNQKWYWVDFERQLIFELMHATLRYWRPRERSHAQTCSKNPNSFRIHETLNSFIATCSRIGCSYHNPHVHKPTCLRWVTSTGTCGYRDKLHLIREPPFVGLWMVVVSTAQASWLAWSNDSWSRRA